LEDTSTVLHKTVQTHAEKQTAKPEDAVAVGTGSGRNNQYGDETGESSTTLTVLFRHVLGIVMKLYLYERSLGF